MERMVGVIAELTAMLEDRRDLFARTVYPRFE